MEPNSEDTRTEAVAALLDVERLIAVARDLNSRPDENQFAYGYRLGLWEAIRLLVDPREARWAFLHPPIPQVGEPCMCGHFLVSHTPYLAATEFTEAIVNCFCGCQMYQFARTT